MKNQIKLLCVALLVIFCISLCTLQAFATPVETESSVTTVNTQATIPTESVVTEPPTTEPIVTEPPTTEPIVTEPPTTVAPTTQPTTVAPTYQQQAQPQTSATSGNVYSETTATYSAVPQPGLYDTDGKRVDTDTLDDSDWEDIANDLQGSDGKGSDGVGNFDFIQKNNDTEDNGLWILIYGILLIVAGLGIIGFIVYSSVRKKKNLNNKGGKHSNNNHSRSSSGSSPTRRKLTPSEKRQINRRSKYDTDEVMIPRNRKPSTKKSPYGGTRYKPKH